MSNFSHHKRVAHEAVEKKGGGVRPFNRETARQPYVGKLERWMLSSAVCGRNLCCTFNLYLNTKTIVYQIPKKISPKYITIIFQIFPPAFVFCADSTSKRMFLKTRKVSLQMRCTLHRLILFLSSCHGKAMAALY